MLPRLRSGLTSALGHLCAALLGAVTLAALAELALAGARGAAPPELAEIQSVLMTWLALLGAAWGVGEGFHLGIDLLVLRAPAPVRPGLVRLAGVLTALFGLLLAWRSAELVARIGNTLPATGWNASVQYLPGVAAGLAIALLALLSASTPGADPEPGPEPAAPDGELAA